MEHFLKIRDEFATDLFCGDKKAEIRFNDRDYRVGDFLIFWHDLPERKKMRITHIHSGLGLQEGYVVLSVERVFD